MTLELPYMKRLLLALGRHRACRVFRQNVGKVLVRGEDGRVRRAFSAGPPKGAADLSGLVMPDGWRLEVETKAARGKQSKAQASWQRFIEASGGVYVLCAYDEALDMRANVAHAVAAVERAIAERRGRG